MCPRCLMELAGMEPDPVEPGPPPRPEELAQVFPRLEVLRLIGRGGMGAVYEARQPELDRRIALKVLPAGLARDPAFAERFEREAHTLARLDHQNIVRVHDAGRAGDWFYLAMEYVDGVDLRQMMRAGECAPRQALAIVAQLCDALQYAHDQGVVHRDIKPENVLIDRRGGVKVADFGLAKLLGRAEGSFQLTRSDQAMGTLHYMAPEQVERPLVVDHRADIYSLGVVMYELLTGELPIGHFPRPSQSQGVDARLDEVVLKTLEKEPARRYQRASEVKTAVGLAHAPQFATAPSASPPEPPGRRGLFGRRHAARSRHAAAGPGQGHGLAWVLGCGCLLLLILGVLGSLFLGVSYQRVAVSQEHEAAVAAQQAAVSSQAREPLGPLIELDFEDGSPRWSTAAVRSFQLSEDERLASQGALGAARDAYLREEAARTARDEREDGMWVFTIEPFPQERAALLAQLQQDLTAVLGPERTARCFSLQGQRGWDELAPYGSWPCELEVWRVGERVAVRVIDWRSAEPTSVLTELDRPLPPRWRRFLP